MSDTSSAFTTGFQLGDAVTAKSQPDITGVVMNAMTGAAEAQYVVFMEGAPKTYYESQLQRAVDSKPVSQRIPVERFNAYLSSLQIEHPSASTLYSLHSAKIESIPYQFRPVLKFIRSDRPRLLIADGVGVGKTIEAGLILKEMQSRRDLNSVLIICPKPLIVEKKWQAEMQRFDERFTQLDGKELRHCIDEFAREGEWPSQHSKTILPYSLLDEALLSGTAKGQRLGRPGLEQLDPPPRFDLVIVDEAHHVRNPSTLKHQAVKYFCDQADAVVFLTATPLEMESGDLYELLHLLRPDLIVDRPSFEHMAAPNAHLNRAIGALRGCCENWRSDALDAIAEAGETPWGRSMLARNPIFSAVKATLNRCDASDEDRVRSIKQLEGLHSFSGIINRTRRRDIGTFTIRRPETIEAEFTESQRRLHDRVLDLQSKILQSLHGNTSVKFMMTTIRRQAASSLFGLVPLLEDILKRRFEELRQDGLDEDIESIDHRAIEQIEDQVRQVIQDASNLDHTDAKLHSLLEILLERKQLPNYRVMVFSAFRHTLTYLHEQLSRQGLRVGVVHGGTPDEDRVQMRQRFKLPCEASEALDVLLFSEVGCEGLDYQFCDCIVNYDLPWNPMRIEQRIGRIDRRGQQSECVSIYNLITPGTVDAEIYQRCLKRIGVFEREIGAGEEILGKITRTLHDIAENQQLTEEERREQLQQLADNEIRLLQEKQELEEKQFDLLGLQVSNTDVDDATSFWLEPAALQNLVTEYLEDRVGGSHEFISGGTDLKTLRLSREARQLLLEDFFRLPADRAESFRRWKHWLKDSDQRLAIAFRSECAAEAPDATLITPQHPLVRQASAYINDVLREPVVVCEVASTEIPPGSYPFVIYEWKYDGLHQDLRLIPIAKDDDVTAELLRWLETASDASRSAETILDDGELRELEDRHYRLWAESRKEHCDQMARIVSFQKESLDASHQAASEVCLAQLKMAKDEKIRRMRRKQLENAEAAYQRRSAELEQMAGRADIVTRLVARGTVIVNGGQ
ncbi:RNA polymerase-associated protein RapA [Stieleria neptunia]|uniref:RNA polymerase-associated protein RapA n=1 Tax=Stieleria neptunia TaxID=2527979 RepID=A0A518I4B6_9BACT|nr:helicase-related protein [Stieleria neptunia]QDV47953.1 RNA polymerase-associated protein RapA [Stieleria neptunia]